MPPKSTGRHSTVDDSSPLEPALPITNVRGSASSTLDQPVLQPTMLALTNQQSSESASYHPPSRPTLPPFSRIQSQNETQITNDAFTASRVSYLTGKPPFVASSNAFQPPPPPTAPYHIPVRSGTGDSQPFAQATESEYSPNIHARSYNPLKRAYELPPAAVERSSYNSSLHGTFLNDLNDRGGVGLSSGASSRSDASTPTTTTTSTYPPGTSMAFSPARSESSAGTNAARCFLHIRQQPRAARAGPDGKDRRPIDPPPILQLLINDFAPDSPTDLAEIRSTFWVVHCRLVSAQSPKKDVSTLASTTEDGSREIQRLLLGTAVASPFLCDDDPDPETMPAHPTTITTTTETSSDPPSPTSRFLPISSAKPQDKSKGKKTATLNVPSAFFIFADLSIRKAGDYRLEFSLMKVEANVLHSGSTLPIIHNVVSQVFRVVNAKDFDQVQPSTNLVKGLLDRGAGFPLKLKKGTREGQRRRGQGAKSEGGDESEEDEDEDEI